MKLHLPVALLAAVVSAMSAAYAANDGITFQKDSVTNDTTVTVTGGNYTDFTMGGDYSKYVSKGAIYGASGDGTVSENRVEYHDVNLNVSGGTGIQYLIGQSEPCGSVVTGDTNIKVSGGEINTLVGGVLYKSGGVYGFGQVDNSTQTLDYKTGNTSETHWAYKDASDPDINIDVTGGTIKQIRGGNTNASEHVYRSIYYALQQDSNGAAYNALMSDKPWAVAGDVNISVGGDAVVGDGKKAIAGAGGSGHSVDGKVTVNVTGGTINGAIYGGSTNIYTEVGSTEVNISGGTINGNVYGGGNYDDGDKKAADFGLDSAVGPTVKGGTTVVLSGGTIDGNVYAAGVKDIVNADADNVGTHVVIKNGGANVIGIISGMGEGATVNGDRLLTIENTAGAGVNWNKIQDFNAVEFKDSQIKFGTLSQEFEKVSAENSHLVGKFEDGSVQLNADKSWLEIDGDLTTTQGSSIANTKPAEDMVVHGDATFQGTAIKNATIIANATINADGGKDGGNLAVNSSSIETNSNLVADGDMSFQQSTMNGGTLSVGGTLSIDGATVVVDSINNGNSVQLKGDTTVIEFNGDIELNGDIEMNAGGALAHYVPTSLTVNSDLKLAADSSFKGTEDMPGLAEGINANLTANSITTEGKVTFDKADVKATQGDITLSDESKVTEGSLTAAENVTIGASSTVTDTTVSAGKDVTIGASSTVSGTTVTAGKDVTIGASSIVSGSSVTATAGDLTVSGSTVTDSSLTAAKNLLVNGSTIKNTDLIATNGSLSISTTNYTTDTKKADGEYYYFRADNIVVENSTINAKKSATYFVGDTNIQGSAINANKGQLYFAGEGNKFTADADSSFNVGDSSGITFGSTKYSTELVSHGATFNVESQTGTLNVNSTFEANNGTEVNIAGTAKFNNDVNAIGTSFTTIGGGSITFNDQLVLDESYVTDGGNSDIKMNGDVVAKNTEFTITGAGSIIFAGDNVQLNGGNKLIATAGSGKFHFDGTSVIANGDNSISGIVEMSNSSLLAESGTLTIQTTGTSTLSDLQKTGAAKINVTATGDRLRLKGTSSIDNLTINNLINYGDEAGATISGNVNVADTVTINNTGDKRTEITSTGSLTTSKLVSNGGEIANGGSLTVNQTSQLTGTTLTSTGTAAFKGDVTSVDSNIVINDGQMKFSETVTATGGEYTAKGGNMNFHGDVNANGTKFTTDGGIIRFYGDVVAENTTFVADGTAPMYFDTETNLTRDKNTVTLNGGNTFEAKDSYFSFSGIDFIANGDNTFKGGFSLGDSERTVPKLDENGNEIVSGNRVQKEKIIVESSFIAQSGVQTIESDKYAISLNNIKIAEDAAEGTKINVTSSAEHMDVYVRGNSSISNLTVLDGAKGFIQGNVNIAEKLVVDSAKSDSITVEETGALTAENVEIKENSGLLNKGSANLKNVSLTDGSSVSNTGETLELAAATVSGSVSIKHNTDGTTKIGGITKSDDSASVSLSQTGGTVEFNGGKGTVAEIDNVFMPNGGSLVHSGEGDVSFYGFMPSKDYSIKQTGTGTMVIGQDAPASDPDDIGGIIQFVGTTTISQSGGGTIVNKGGIAALGFDGVEAKVNLDISNGSTFENMCSVSLSDVAISDATLFNAGAMSMDSLVMDNATLLFAASSLDSCSSFIFTGADLTGYGISNVSAADMIKEIGFVMSGADAAGLLQQWGSEQAFTFTLAEGTELFAKDFAYVLKQNMDEFTITLGDAAELSFADGEIKELTIEATEDGKVIVSGIAVIPEPTTATLSLLALAALAARRRRK